MTAMSPDELLAAWEDAYLAQSHSARVGRLFKGTIHNLNGIIQAFSMQSELFEMMFRKADRLLAEAADICGEQEAKEKIGQTLELLDKRQKTLAQVEEKIGQSQQILKNSEDISRSGAEGGTVSMQDLVTNVVSFFNSHMFFKHKVQKEIAVDLAVEISDHQAPALTMALANLIENSIVALERRGDQSGRFVLRCSADNDAICIEIEDNGAGVAEQVQGKLFDAFVSTYPDHPGLGLYLAQRLLAKQGGTIALKQAAQPTLFTISLPVAALGA